MIKKLFLLLVGSLTINLASAQCVASFTVSMNPICRGNSVTFTDLSSGATGVVTYSWNFGAGAAPATSTLKNPPAVTYSTAGVKTVTLTYKGTGGGGCTVTSTQTITVNAPPTANFTSNSPQCTGANVNFTNTGTVAGVNWSWSFGSGSSPSSSSAQTPTGIVYSTSGAKTVSLTTTNPLTGCFATVTKAVTINQTPTASFTDNAPQCSGSGVNFTNTGTAAGVTWAWTFAGGAPAVSAVQNPAGVTFAAAGTDAITLTTKATASGCSATTTQDITIDQTPTASFTSNAPKCTGAGVTFTNTSTAGANIVYNWSFGGGATPSSSTTQSPSGVMFSTAGLIPVTLTVTNTLTGCSSSVTNNITINQTPTASFTDNAPQCSGSGVNFTNTGTAAGVTWAWTFAGGAPAVSAVQNPAGVTFAAAGTDAITLTTKATASGCSATATQDIIIDQTPTASFTSTAPQCTGAGVNFTNTGSSGANIVYNWNFGAGASPATSTAQNPTGVTFSTSGSVTVTLTVTNTLTGCSATTTQSITINQGPTASFSDNAPQCMGAAVNFTNTGSTGAGFTYSWSFGAAATPLTSVTQNQAGVTYSASGAQTVTLTTTAIASGCSATATQVITINPEPTATFTSNAPQCAGNSVNFTNTGSSGAGITYSWSFGAGATPATSTTESPSGVMYSTPGTKLVTFTVDNGTCTAVDTMSIAIDSTTIASFTSNAPQCMGSAVNFTNTGSATSDITYSWNFGPNATPLTSTLASPAGVTFSTSGAQTITLTVTNTTTGCSNMVTQVITINPEPTATFTSNAPQCAGNSVNFTNTGSSGAGITYDWTFGAGANPATSNAESPTGVIYSTPGTRLITFTVDNGTCTAVDTMSIAIDSTTIASFTSNAPQCMGSAVNFTNTGSATSDITYSWNFGPNATPLTSTLASPAGVTFSTSGAQTITLTVTNTTTGCSNMVTQVITINPEPTATFTSNAPQCAGNSVNFTNTGSSGAGITYDWTFGAGANPATSNAESPTGVIYSTPGTKLITFTVDNGTCTAVDTMSIAIDSTTIASFTSNAPQCMGSAVNFTNTGSATSDITYSWKLFGPNATPLTSTLASPAGVTFSTSGAQTITLTVTNTTTGCSNMVTQVITINPEPAATFTSNAPQCAGNSVNFTNTGSSGAGITYSWSFGAGATPATSTTESPSGVMYSTPGTKLVTFTVDNGTCTAVDTMSIAIDSTTIASFTSNAPQCMGSAVNFTNTGSATSDITYSWNFGPNATPLTSTLASPAGVTFSTSGAQTITLTVTNTTTGCSNMVTQVITINPEPTATFTSNAPQCAGNSVNFTNTGSSGAGITYDWTFGAGANPATSNAESPTGVIYSTPGTRLITFTVDNGTCTAVDTMSIAIDSTTIASFTSNAPQCMGSAVNFTNTGSATSDITYSWNFGPNATPLTSTLASPAGVTFSTSGAQTITLTVTNTTTGCSNMVTQVITINPEPTATFTSNAPQCAGNSVNFTNTGSSGAGITYDWTFGAGANPATSNAESPTGVIYSTPGTKLITFTVDNGTCTAVDTMSIAIDSTTIASFTSNAPQCMGSAVNFTNTGSATSDITYSWNFGPNATPLTSTLASPAGVTFSTSGAQTITLTVTNTTTGCSNMVTQVITINPEPTATFTSNAPQCAGNSVNFTNTGSSGAGITYDWTFGAGANPATSNAESPTGVIYSTPGTKLITFTVDNGTCTAVDTMSIAIDSTTVASFTSNAPQCMGSAVNFTNTGSSTSDITYSWNFGPNATPLTSTLASPAGVTFSTSGAQTITLTVTNTTTGCSNMVTQVITINPEPTATFTSNAPQCAGNSVNFTNTGSSGAGITYSWSFGKNAAPATSTTESPIGIIYSTPGIKLVTFTVDNGACTAVDTMSIVIDSNAVASFTDDAPKCTGDSVNFTNTGSSTSDITYNWNFGPNANPLTSTVENPTGVVFSLGGIQTITLIVTNTTTGCTSSVTKTITINQTPTATFTSNAPQCAGNAVNFTNTGTTGVGVTYRWDFGKNSTPNLSNGENPSGIVYSTGGFKIVTFIVNNGSCSAVDTMTIAIDSLPVASAGHDTTLCSVDSLQIGATAIAGYTYSWSPATGLSATNVSNPEAHVSVGTNVYVLTVTNAAGCTSVDSVTIIMLPPITASAGSPVSSCRGDSVRIGSLPVAGETYLWKPTKGLNDSTIANPMASPDSTTTYTVTVTGSGCKPATDHVTVTVYQPPVVTVSATTDSVAIGSSTQLSATGGVEYAWTPTTWLNDGSVANPISTPDSTIKYFVTATDIFGCAGNDSITIYVISGAFWAPTAFTPNGDGKDDIFYIHGTGISNFELDVYNRWGEQIFRSQDINQGWDGRRQISGEQLPDGAYVYYVKGNTSDGKSINTSGMINLIR